MTALAERDRIREYTKREVSDILEAMEAEVEDSLWFAGICIDPFVFEIDGKPTLQHLTTKSVRFFYSDQAATGYYAPVGGRRIVIMNVFDTIDYSLLSDLHPTADADVYTLLCEPWEQAGERCEWLHMWGEWYRDESFPNHYREVCDE